MTASHIISHIHIHHITYHEPQCIYHINTIKYNIYHSHAPLIHTLLIHTPLIHTPLIHHSSTHVIHDAQNTPPMHTPPTHTTLTTQAPLTHITHTQTPYYSVSNTKVGKSVLHFRLKPLMHIGVSSIIAKIILLVNIFHAYMLRADWPVTEKLGHLCQGQHGSWSKVLYCNTEASRCLPGNWYEQYLSSVFSPGKLILLFHFFIFLML